MQLSDAFIQEHERLVHGLAGRLSRELALRSDKDDLVAFGYGGLLEARRRFDPARGVQFQTFAYYRVRGAMLDGIRRMAYLPRRAHEKARAAQEAAPAPTALDKAFARMSARLTMGAGPRAEAGSDDPESSLLRKESLSRLLKALSTLPPRERALVRGFYFEGRQFDEIASELGISKSWASRLHAKALAALRETLEHD